MKPLKLEIEGVNSFQDNQIIDFEELASNNLFCISGVTGSGKTTILDSLILALYEKLPSNSSRGNIDEYINLRREKAIIKLTFDLDGKIYRSERVISRKKGANTAKLIDVDAGVTVKEKSDETFKFLGEKLGLDVEQFAQVIVLQQGAFAQFLKAGKADRNKMVINLFKLDRFESVPKKFKDAQQALGAKIQNLDKDIEEYSEITEKSLTELEKQIKDCSKSIELKTAERDKWREMSVKAEISERKQREYDAALIDKQNAEKRKASLEERKKRLQIMSEQIAVLEKRVKDRRVEKEQRIAEKAKLESDAKQLEEIRKREQELKIQREKYRELRAETDKLKAVYESSLAEIAKLNEEKSEYANLSRDEILKKTAENKMLLENNVKNSALLKKAEAEATERSLKIEAAEKLLTECENNVVAAEKTKAECKQAAQKARIEMGADALRRGLKRGDVCPVCGEILTKDPVVNGTNGCESAEKALEAAEKACDAALNRQNAVKVELSGLNSEQKACLDKIAEYKVGVLLDDAPVKIETEKLTEREKKLKDIENKQKLAAEQKAEWEKAEALIKQSLERGMQDRKALDERKAALGECDFAVINAKIQKLYEIIGAIDKEDGDFEKLRTSSEHEKNQIVGEDSELNASIAAVEKVLADKPEKFEFTSAEYGAKATQAEREKEELLELRAGAEKSAEHMRLDLDRKKKLKVERAELNKQYEKIYDIWKAMSSGEFIAFVAAEYIKDFTYNASVTLGELTGGKYSLRYEEEQGDFYVTDFLNNNESRKIKTLSGGETFLASLSMAIALSQEIARYGNFDFFFIDEGFGTLHEQALEQALEVLLRLSRSSLVGIVTHRTELIDRIPMTLLVTQASEDEGSVCRIL